MALGEADRRAVERLEERAVADAERSPFIRRLHEPPRLVRGEDSSRQSVDPVSRQTGAGSQNPSLVNSVLAELPLQFTNPIYDALAQRVGLLWTVVPSVLLS